MPPAGFGSGTLRFMTGDDATRGRMQALAPLFWMLAGGLVCAWMTPLEPSLLEEGYIVHIAQRLVAGDVLYRDVVTFTGPLPFEALALLFRIFGERIEVGRFAVCLLHALACGAAFALVRRASPGWPAHAAACALACAPVLLFPLYSMYFYSTLAGSFSFMAGHAALRGLRSPAWALAAGALVAAVALSKQTVGVVLALALLGALAVASRRADEPVSGRPVRAFVAGGLAVAVLTLLAYAASGDLVAVLRSLVVLPLSLRETFDAPYINLWPPGRLAPDILDKWTFYLPYLGALFTRDAKEPAALAVAVTQALFVLPLLAAACTAFAAARRRLPAATLIQTAVFAGLCANLFPRTDWGHLVFVLPAAMAQLMSLVGRPPDARAPLGRAATIASGALIAALAVGAAAQGRLLHRVTEQGSWGPHVHQRPINRSLRGDAIPAVIRYIRAHTEPGEPIFVARAEPLLYFATDTTNPTPYGGVIPGLHEEQQVAILEGLERVRYVVMSEIDHPFFTYYRDELPEVEAYLERHFEVARPFTLKRTWLLVLERGADRGATAIDLMSPDLDVRAFTRSEAGLVDAAGAELPRLPNHHNRRPRPFAIGPLGGGLDHAFVVPAGARLQLGAGVDELVGLRDRFVQPPDSEVVISIAEEGDAGDATGFVELSRTAILDGRRDARRWVPVEVDLSDWEGRRVVLRLELRTTRTEVGERTLGWFGSPRIARPPGEPPESAPAPGDADPGPPGR